MRIRINIKKVVLNMIFLLYLLKFVISYWDGSWEFVSGKYTMVPIYNSINNRIRLAYIIFLLLFGLFEMIIQWKRMRIIDRVIILLLFLGATLKLIQTIKIVDMQTILFEAGTPVVYYMILTFFIGMDNSLKSYLLKITKNYSFIFFCLTFLYFMGFSVEHGYNIGLRFASGPILYAFNNAFFLLVYALYEETNFKHNKFWHIMLPVCVIGTFITTSRGWVLQGLLMVFMYFVLAGNSKRVVRNVMKALIAAIFIIFLVRITASDLFTTLVNRLGESTRSSQLEMFFNQVSVKDLIRGFGYNATYTFFKDTNYRYIDNQVIFSAFRYGIVITALYLYFIVVPVFIAIKRGKEKLFRTVGLFHFLLALLGLSIYFSISIEIYCISVYLLAGRLYSNTYDSINDQKENN